MRFQLNRQPPAAYLLLLLALLLAFPACKRKELKQGNKAPKKDNQDIVAIQNAFAEYRHARADRFLVDAQFEQADLIAFRLTSLEPQTLETIFRDKLFVDEIKASQQKLQLTASPLATPGANAEPKSRGDLGVPTLIGIGGSALLIGALVGVGLKFSLKDGASKEAADAAQIQMRKSYSQLSVLQQENADLKAQLGAKDEHFSRLSSESEQTGEALKEAQRKLGNAQDLLAKGKLNTNQMLGQIKNLEGNLTAAQGHQQRTADHLRDAQIKIGSAESTQQAMQTQINNLQSSLQEAQNQNLDLKQSLSDAVDLNASMAQDNADLAAALSSSRDAENALNSAQEDLTDRLKTANSALNAMQTENNTLRTSLQGATDRLGEVEALMVGLGTDLEKVGVSAENVDQIQKDVAQQLIDLRNNMQVAPNISREDLLRQVQDWQEKLGQSIEEHELMEKQIDALKKQMLEVEKKRLASEKKFGDTYAELVAAKKAASDLLAEQVKIAGALKEAGDANADLQRALKVNKASLEAAESAAAEIQEKSNKLGEMLATAEQQRVDLTAQLSAAQQESQQLADSNRLLATTLQATKDEVAGAQGENSKLKGELDAALAEKNRLEAETLQLKSKLEAASGELASTQDDLKQTQDELKQLQTKVKEMEQRANDIKNMPELRETQERIRDLLAEEIRLDQEVKSNQLEFDERRAAYFAMISESLERGRLEAQIHEQFNKGRWQEQANQGSKLLRFETEDFTITLLWGESQKTLGWVNPLASEYRQLTRVSVAIKNGSNEIRNTPFAADFKSGKESGIALESFYEKLQQNKLHALADALEASLDQLDVGRTYVRGTLIGHEYLVDSYWQYDKNINTERIDLGAPSKNAAEAYAGRVKRYINEIIKSFPEEEAVEVQKLIYKRDGSINADPFKDAPEHPLRSQLEVLLALDDPKVQLLQRAQSLQIKKADVDAYLPGHHFQDRSLQELGDLPARQRVLLDQQSRILSKLSSEQDGIAQILARSIKSLSLTSPSSVIDKLVQKIQTHEKKFYAKVLNE